MRQIQIQIKFKSKARQTGAVFRGGRLGLEVVGVGVGGRWLEKARVKKVVVGEW